MGIGIVICTDTRMPKPKTSGGNLAQPSSCPDSDRLRGLRWSDAFFWKIVLYITSTSVLSGSWRAFCPSFRLGIATTAFFPLSGQLLEAVRRLVVGFDWILLNEIICDFVLSGNTPHKVHKNATEPHLHAVGDSRGKLLVTRTAVCCGGRVFFTGIIVFNFFQPSNVFRCGLSVSLVIHTMNVVQHFHGRWVKLTAVMSKVLADS